MRNKVSARGLDKLKWLFAVLLFCAVACFGQQGTDTTSTTPTPPSPPPRPQFFAGIITAITDQEITVSRTLLGHPTDTRTFQLTKKTKINREHCELNTKVTVRYQRLPEGNVALQVIAHPSRSKKP